MVKWLSGKKVYLTALFGALYGLLIATKVVANDAAVWTIIASGNIASWRAALGKVVIDTTPAPTPAASTVDVAAIQAAVSAISQAVEPKP